MNTEELQQWIKDNIYNPNKINIKRVQKNGEWVNKHHPSIHESILNKTSFLISPSYKERIYCILNNILTPVMCENCKITRVNFHKHGYLNYCSVKCGTSSEKTILKKKETSLKKYGDPNYNNRDKFKETNRERYGYDHHWMDSDIRAKSIDTCMSNYGTDNPSKSDIIKQKKIDTCILNYGVDYPYQSDIVKQKGIDTNRRIRDVDNPFQCEDVKSKSKNTKRKKYGNENYNNPEKIKYTHRQKFQSNILSDILNNIQENTEHKILHCDVNNILDKIELRCKNGHTFKRNLNSLTYNILCPYCRIKTTKPEKEIMLFLENYIDKSDIIDHHRIYDNGNDNPKSFTELDIYLPDHNIAIEYNGIYWHSEENGKGRNYHLNKTKLCEENGVQLLHIFSNEWNYKQDIVKSVILSKLGIYEHRYYARKCYIKQIDNNTKNNFLNKYHLQGDDNSSIKLGLYYDNELLSVMTFGKRKITGGSLAKFELIRFCNKLNTQVVGGASKLFKYFINNHNYDNIVTYVDRRWSNGKFYSKLGFKFTHCSKPNYWYFNNNNRLYHRASFQKHKLHNKLDVFDPSLPEYDNMVSNGWNRIWDCGNYVFKYK